MWQRSRCLCKRVAAVWESSRKLQPSQVTWPRLWHAGGQLNLYHFPLHPWRAMWPHLVPACARQIKTGFVVVQWLFPTLQAKTPQKMKAPIREHCSPPRPLSVLNRPVIDGSLQIWAVLDTPSHSHHSIAQVSAPIYLFIFALRLLSCTALVNNRAEDDQKQLLFWSQILYLSNAVSSAAESSGCSVLGSGTLTDLSTDISNCSSI